MSNFRTEMSIPVTRDSRTFEQRHEDMLTNLGRRTSTRLGKNESGSNIRSDTTASSLTTDSTLGGSPFGQRDDWDKEVDRWITGSRSHFSDEMKRMKQDMFALEPVDDFSFDRWRDMPSIGGDRESMISRMERQMQSMSQEMQSLGGIGSTRPLMTSNMGGLPGGSSHQTSSSRITTSSTTSSGSDPRAMKTQSNVKESVSHSKTINGQTTGSSSHSSVSSSSTGQGGQLTSTTTPGALLATVPGSSSGPGMLGSLKDTYELDEDGQVHFKVRFDAKDFAPEDIDVTTVDSRLTVNAKKAIKGSGSETVKEFCRTIDLPRTIDHENFQCNLTDDGILILDAPVKAPDYHSITFGNDQQLGIRPRSITETQQSSTGSSQFTTLQTLGMTGPTILKEGINGRKLHLEVPVDAGYKAEDLCVRTDSKRIIVSGRQNSGGGGVSTSEFTRSYEIPETVDPFTVTAQLTGTTLIIEAPLLCSV